MVFTDALSVPAILRKCSPQMCRENSTFVRTKKSTMKNLVFPLLLTIVAVPASAQLPQIADTVAREGLPVLRSYVPPDVVRRAARKYGRSLYCIEKSTAANCQDSYLVGLLRGGGSLKMEWMCDDPKMVLHRGRARVSDAAAF